jgi:hypothetical protein
MATVKVVVRRKGGGGSGNWGHSGRPGLVGGSAPSGAVMTVPNGAEIEEARAWYIKGGAYRLNNNQGSMDRYDREQAKNFMATFNTIPPLEEPIQLFRGVGNGSYKNQIGQFWSTTSEESVAKSYTKVELYKDSHNRWRERKAGEVLIINVQPGVRVMKMNNIDREYVIERDVAITETNRTIQNGITWIWITISK